MISPEIQKLLDDPRFPRLLKAIWKSSGEIISALQQEVLPRDITLLWLKRFEALDIMFYRDNVASHWYRIDSMIHSIMISSDILINRALIKRLPNGFLLRDNPIMLDIKEFLSSIDFYRAWFIAIHHDDTEWFSWLWDIPTPVKKWLPDDLKSYLDEFESVISMQISDLVNLGDEYISLEPNPYLEILDESQAKDSVESQLNSYLDKLDWFMSCFHEVTAGNILFVEPFRNYIKYFKEFKLGKLTKILPFFSDDFQKVIKLYHIAISDLGLWHSYYRDISIPKWFMFFLIDDIIAQWDRVQDLLSNWKPHTVETVLNSDFGFPAYKVWKDCFLKTQAQVLSKDWRLLNSMEILTIKRE